MLEQAQEQHQHQQEEQEQQQEQEQESEPDSQLRADVEEDDDNPSSRDSTQELGDYLGPSAAATDEEEEEDDEDDALGAAVRAVLSDHRPEPRRAPYLAGLTDEPAPRGGGGGGSEPEAVVAGHARASARSFLDSFRAAVAQNSSDEDEEQELRPSLEGPGLDMHVHTRPTKYRSDSGDSGSDSRLSKPPSSRWGAPSPQLPSWAPSDRQQQQQQRRPSSRSDAEATSGSDSGPSRQSPIRRKWQSGQTSSSSSSRRSHRPRKNQPALPRLEKLSRSCPSVDIGIPAELNFGQCAPQSRVMQVPSPPQSTNSTALLPRTRNGNPDSAAGFNLPREPSRAEHHCLQPARVRGRASRGDCLRGSRWLTAAIPIENPYCSCKLTRVRSIQPALRRSGCGLTRGRWCRPGAARPWR